MALRYGLRTAARATSAAAAAPLRPAGVGPRLNVVVLAAAGAAAAGAAASAPLSTNAARPNRRRQRVGGRFADRWEQQQQVGETRPAHPKLADTLRKFYLKVHPDLFTHHPTEKEANQEAFARFQSFLDDVRDRNTAPPRAGLHSYRFYLKTQEEGQFREVSLEMRTTGGDCRNLVQKSLERFFAECGLPERFTWAESDWQYTIEPPPSEEERERMRRREEEGY